LITGVFGKNSAKRFDREKVINRQLIDRENLTDWRFVIHLISENTVWIFLGFEKQVEAKCVEKKKKIL
jgi:hypothetical protein